METFSDFFLANAFIMVSSSRAWQGIKDANQIMYRFRDMRNFTLYFNMWMDKQSIIFGLSAQISVTFDVY